MSIQVGQKVDNFTMETYEPKAGDFGSFSLADNTAAGKWAVLMFYPADFTFVCATEFAALAGQHAALEAMGVSVLSVSTDTKFTHLAWQREEGELAAVKYSMAADPTGKVSRLFGVYNEANGLDFRGTFIINPSGVLVGAEVNVNNVGRNMEELVRKVKAFQYVAAHGDEVCPANWSEGAKTLKPNAKLVGRVSQALKG